MNHSGVYEILNTANGKRYIGSAKNMRARWAEHIRDLHHTDHSNQHLQCAWNKYSEGVFKFLPILTCQKSMLLFYEQQLLDKAKPEYNIALNARAPFQGLKHTPAALLKISLGNKGKITPRERIIRMAEARRGIPLTAEHKAKVVASLIGNTNGRGKKYGPMSALHKARISIALLGKKKSPEHIAKISATKRRKV